MRCFQKIIAATPVLALLIAVALPAAAQEQAADAVSTNEIQAPRLEPRWLPWLGCWELVADAVDYREVERTGRRVVCVAPRLDGLGVNLTTRIDDEVIADNTVIADGTERALPEADCSGYQRASWSADGHRLYSGVSAQCGENAARSVQGLNMLVDGGRWIEIQSVSLDDGEHRELVVRQYDRLDNAATQRLGFATLDTALSARAATARAAAAGPLDVDDVIETNELFPVEVVEAAILESNTMFALDTDALFKLADAGIEDRVIDLMVAVSFPEQFVVDTGTASGGGGGGGWVYGATLGYYGVYPGCWGHYYSPFYGPYGPGCGSYWYPSYYGGYRPPYYGGGFRPVIGPSGSLYGGKVINRNGYIRPRTAENLPSDGGSVSVRPRANSSGLGYTVRRAFRRDGGSVGRSGGGVRRTGSSRPGSVSRTGGFSKPSSSGGGSSSGSSGSKPKAKPRGGGGGTKAKPRGGGH